MPQLKRALLFTQPLKSGMQSSIIKYAMFGLWELSYMNFAVYESHSKHRMWSSSLTKYKIKNQKVSLLATPQP